MTDVKARSKNALFHFPALAFALLAALLLVIPASILGAVATGQAQAFNVTVPAQGNVFAAGVGGTKANGSGKKPTVVDFEPVDPRQVLWFTSVLGKVSCCSGGSTFNGPEGGTNAGGSTDILSSGGISGVIHQTRTMFLVGIFIGYPGPSAAATPQRRNVTYDAGKLDIYPALNQTFYIGDGKVGGGNTMQRYHVPRGANRLVLGFADAFAFHGTPGAYDDNVGELHVQFKIAPY